MERRPSELIARFRDAPPRPREQRTPARHYIQSSFVVSPERRSQFLADEQRLDAKSLAVAEAADNAIAASQSFIERRQQTVPGTDDDVLARALAVIESSRRLFQDGALRGLGTGSAAYSSSQTTGPNASLLSFMAGTSPRPSGEPAVHGSGPSGTGVGNGRRPSSISESFDGVLAILQSKPVTHAAEGIDGGLDLVPPPQAVGLSSGRRPATRAGQANGAVQATSPNTSLSHALAIPSLAPRPELMAAVSGAGAGAGAGAVMGMGMGMTDCTSLAAGAVTVGSVLHELQYEAGEPMNQTAIGTGAVAPGPRQALLSPPKGLAAQASGPPGQQYHQGANNVEYQDGRLPSSHLYDTSLDAVMAGLEAPILNGPVSSSAMPMPHGQASPYRATSSGAAGRHDVLGAYAMMGQPSGHIGTPGRPGTSTHGQVGRIPDRGALGMQSASAATDEALATAQGDLLPQQRVQLREYLAGQQVPSAISPAMLHETSSSSLQESHISNISAVGIGPAVGGGANDVPVPQTSVLYGEGQAEYVSPPRPSPDRAVQQAVARNGAIDSFGRQAGPVPVARPVLAAPFTPPRPGQGPTLNMGNIGSIGATVAATSPARDAARRATATATTAAAGGMPAFDPGSFGSDALTSLYATAEQIRIEDPETTVARLRRRLAAIDDRAVHVLAPYLPQRQALGPGHVAPGAGPSTSHASRMQGGGMGSTGSLSTWAADAAARTGMALDNAAARAVHPARPASTTSRTPARPAAARETAVGVGMIVSPSANADISYVSAFSGLSPDSSGAEGSGMPGRLAHEQHTNADGSGGGTAGGDGDFSFKPASGPSVVQQAEQEWGPRLGHAPAAAGPSTAGAAGSAAGGVTAASGPAVVTPLLAKLRAARALADT